MSSQIQITGETKVKSLTGVLVGTTGVVSSLAFDVAGGVPKLDVNGKILVAQLPNSVMEYKGVWNAATNSPTLTNGGAFNEGDVYLCNVAGTVNFGAGPIAFFVGDQAIYSGSIWQRASGATGTVTSVAVTESGDSLNITGSPITTSGTINIGFNGTNLQYVNGAGNLTTFPILTGYVTAVSGTAPVVSSGGTTPAISMAAATGSVDGYLLATDFAIFNAKQSALTFSSPLVNTSGTISIPAATTSVNGYLASADFTTFNNKQNAITLTTTGSSGVSTLVGATLNIPDYGSALTGYVTLATTQTITGAKTFSAYTTFTSTVDITSGLTFSNSGFTLVLQPPTLSVNRTVTLPNGTGTLALTSDISYPVTSVFGRTGAVVATSGDYTTAQVTESGNLYFTDSRARLALSFVAGSGAYNSTTGVITIPTNNNQITNGAGYTTNVGTVTSVAATGGTGISITGSPITTSGTITITNTAPDQTVALTASTGISVTGTYPNFTITNTSPSSGGTVTSVAALTIGTSGTDLSSTVATSTTTPVITLNVPTASAANRGALASADWSTFNSKQGTITLTTTGTSGAATFSANTLNIPNYGSALSGYLPLTGGTLTGALSGTSASFTSLLLNGGSLIGNFTINGGTGDTTTQNAIQTFTRTSSTGNVLAAKIVLVASDTNYGNLVLRVKSTASSAESDAYYTNALTLAGSTGAATFTSSVTATSLIKSGGTSAQFLMADGSTSTLTNPVTGTGTTNYLPKFTGASTIGNSAFYDGGGFGGFNSTGLGSRTFVINAANARPLALEMIEYANVHAVYVRPNNSGYNLISSNYISGGVYNPLALSGRENNTDLVITTSGNVEIGNSAVANLYKLDVNGTGRFSKVNGDSRLIVYQSGTAPYTATLELSSQTLGTYGGVVQYDGGAENLTIENYGRSASASTQGDINFRTKVSNTTPTNILNLDGFTGAATFSSSVTATNYLASSTESFRTYNDNGYISFFNSANTTRQGYLQIQSTALTLAAEGGSAFMVFATGGGSERMRITSGGQIYINTTSLRGTGYQTGQAGQLGAEFTNYGGAQWFTNVNNAEGTYLVLGKSRGTSVNSVTAVQNNDILAGLIFQGTTGTQTLVGAGIFAAVDGTVTASDVPSRLTFMTSVSSGSLVERMRITSGGEVAIGRTDGGGGRLGVRGATSNGAANAFYVDNSSSVELFSVRNDGVVYLKGNVTSAGSVTATGFFESSDMRIKTLIQDNYQTKNIASITPKLYTKNGKVELGYYAQDFVGILDSAVSKGSDDMLSLSYREVLVAKVYALEQEIKELKAK